MGEYDLITWKKKWLRYLKKSTLQSILESEIRSRKKKLIGLCTLLGTVSYFSMSPIDFFLIIDIM